MVSRSEQLATQLVWVCVICGHKHERCILYTKKRVAEEEAVEICLEAPPAK